MLSKFSIALKTFIATTQHGANNASIRAASLLVFGVLFCEGSLLRASQAENHFEPWTAIAVTPDGFWGAATEPGSGNAISNAIANCKKKYNKRIGCGAIIKMARTGWILIFRCGDENIIVAEKNLADAKKMAAMREKELRSVYVPNMSACKRVLTIDPHGAVTEVTARQF
jgi:hypothetical protein